MIWVIIRSQWLWKMRKCVKLKRYAAPSAFLSLVDTFISFLPYLLVKWSESRLVVSNSLWPPWTTQSMEFSRPEYWNGYLFPSPGDLPHPGFRLGSSALQADSLSAKLPGKNPFLFPRGSWISFLGAKVGCDICQRQTLVNMYAFPGFIIYYVFPKAVVRCWMLANSDRLVPGCYFKGVLPSLCDNWTKLTANSHLKKIF